MLALWALTPYLWRKMRTFGKYGFTWDAIFQNRMSILCIKICIPLTLHKLTTVYNLMKRNEANDELIDGIFCYEEHNKNAYTFINGFKIKFCWRKKIMEMRICRLLCCADNFPHKQYSYFMQHTQSVLPAQYLLFIAKMQLADTTYSLHMRFAALGDKIQNLKNRFMLLVSFFKW